ncbi:MAG: Ig-like domain-containing protein [Prevotella sp.]|nr:Ig-like domain-containing protein [Prevotella sp.]MDD6671640.1 Ig-like domain-containing protein [Prevotella sp.]MDD6754153.1 Ig-like domain-containing protein [Prevotella sp.]MDY5182580.1 Ig-like domain-containing protein [Prevotella sp.]
MTGNTHPLLKAWTGLLLACILAAACARMGNPDGGWYDETPPRVIGASPSDKAAGVSSRKVHIYFDEYIKIDNATEKVVVSPPQLEMPEIKAQGKRIAVSLLDSLKPNTTYTIDFSDAISDNNEGNPLGNYTYSFSTGKVIDTLEVAGTVLDASNLEPVKGILVGLYDDLADSAFRTKPMLRVSRTDSQGRFIIKGVASGKYRIYALQDADGNYMFNQKSEMIAFSNDTIEPSFKPDIRQDTLWRDSLHIDVVSQVHYTHFLPDDICLMAFNETVTDRFFLKRERKSPEQFTLFYSHGADSLPEVRGLNFDINDSTFVIDASEHNDTITYWLRDTALVNNDSLEIEVRHLITDTLGNLVSQTDTISLFAKVPYAKRLKEKTKELEKWQKEQEKKKRKGQDYDSIPPREMLKYTVKGSDLDPDKNVIFQMSTPLLKADVSMMHLYSKPPKDSLWYEERFRFEKQSALTYILKAEWKPEYEYSFEIDSLAFEDIYGLTSDKGKHGFKVKPLSSYATLLFTIEGMKGKNIVCQLLNGSDTPVKEVATSNATAQFFFVTPGTYYLRLFVDDNGNGIWDTGDYAKGTQPEKVYYYHEAIECKAKWDYTESWNPTARAFTNQKPEKITKQKADKKKTVKSRNLQRAKELGKEYIPKAL